mmetsp:Transcript_26038/g.46962  ORF Transcript_26038/g.46962 Transcript_26038/m.46962 type:complete len:87 (+) Transcript_26038:1111-1371(+)
MMELLGLKIGHVVRSSSPHLRRGAVSATVGEGERGSQQNLRRGRQPLKKIVVLRGSAKIATLLILEPKESVEDALNGKTLLNSPTR